MSRSTPAQALTRPDGSAAAAASSAATPEPRPASVPASAPAPAPAPEGGGLLTAALHPHQPEAPTRVRRPADLLAFAVATLAVALGLLIAHGFPVGSEELTSNVVHLTNHLPRTLVAVCAVVAALGTLAVVVTMAITMLRRRRLDALNALVAGLLALALGTIAVTLWHAHYAVHGGVSNAMLGTTDGSTLVRDGVIVALLTGSDMVRSPKWTRWCVLAVSALIITGVALEQLTVFAALIVPLAGWACGLIVRWVLKAASWRPTLAVLTDGLREAGIDVAWLRNDESGDASVVRGGLGDGSEITVVMAGRDTRGEGLVRRAWASLRLRGAAVGHRPLGLRAALETEALATLLANEAGISAPRVLLVTNFEPDTLVLVRQRIDGPSPGEDMGDAGAADLFRVLRSLHRIGIAHRDLRAENLVVSPGFTGFRSLGSAAVGAGDLVQRLDIAQLLTTIAALGGATAAVAAMRAGYEPDDERSIIAVLQPIALAGWGGSRMRSARPLLGAVRNELLGSEEVEVPEVRLERWRWRTVVIAILTTVAAFVLVGQLKRVNLAGALSHTDLAWFGVALFASAVTYLGSTINLVAFVPQRVSIVKGTFVELSGAFVGLVTPPTVGHVAVNARFLRKQGVSVEATGAAVAVSQVVNFLVSVILLLVTVLITGTGGGHFSIVPGPRLLAVLGGLVFVFAIFLAVPFGRQLITTRLWPRVRAAIPQLLDVLSQPLRLTVGVLGNLLLTSSYVVALIASLHAVGAHPPIIATAAVYLAANTVGTAAPTPGGIGAVEAVMAAALTAIGVPAHQAVPGVLIFRIATFWLPILPGWIAFVVLRRMGTL